MQNKQALVLAGLLTAAAFSGCGSDSQIFGGGPNSPSFSTTNFPDVPAGGLGVRFSDLNKLAPGTRQIRVSVYRPGSQPGSLELVDSRTVDINTAQAILNGLTPGQYQVIVELLNQNGLIIGYSEGLVSSVSSDRPTLIENPVTVIAQGASDPTVRTIQRAIETAGAGFEVEQNFISDEPVDLRDNRTGLDVDAEAATAPVVLNLGNDPMPPTFSWTQKDGRDWTTPIRNQGSNGTCVAFGVLGVVESVRKISKVEPLGGVDFSEFQLFQAGTPNKLSANNAADDGWTVAAATQYLASGGTGKLVLESYIPYGYAGFRRDEQTINNQKTKVSHYPFRYEPQSIPPQANLYGTNIFFTKVAVQGNRDNIKRAIQLYGPVIAHMDAWRADFYYYARGAYEPVSGDEKGKKKKGSGHCFAIVGWDDRDQAWVCRNSWGPTWGADPNNVRHLSPTSTYADNRRGTNNELLKYPLAENGYFRVKFGKAEVENDIYACTRYPGPFSDTQGVDSAVFQVGTGLRAASPIGLRQATNLTDNAGHPWLSPDGRRVAFDRVTSGANHDIFVLDLAGGGGLRNITNTPDVDDILPAWSPDSGMIAYSSGSATAHKIKLFRADELPAEGSDWPKAEGQTPSDHSTIVELSGDSLHACFSPDSNQIAFCNNSAGSYDLYIRPSVRTNLVSGDLQPRRILTTPGVEEKSVRWGASGTSQLLAFLSNRDGNDEVYTCTPGGDSLRRVSNTAVNEKAIDFVSESGFVLAVCSGQAGREIVWTGSVDGNSQVFTGDNDGTWSGRFSLIPEGITGVSMRITPGGFSLPGGP